MSYNWTVAQRAAIETFGRDVLVSAAAGSGKTAALTERIILALTRKNDPIDITRVLAVTFTRASAAELRRRISKAISERIAADPSNKHLIRQLMLLGSAKICTIDSFCSDVVRSNFQKLTIPAGFRIPDDTELQLLKKSVMDEVIDRAFDGGDRAFASLADSLTSNKDDEALWQTLIAIYDRLLGLPEGVDYLKEGASTLKAEANSNYLSHTRAGRKCAEELGQQLKYYIELLDNATQELSYDPVTLKKYYPAFAADLEYCRALLSAIEAGDYNAAKAMAASLPKAKLVGLPADSKTPRTELWRLTRGDIREGMKKLYSEYFSLSDDQLKSCFIRTGELCDALYKIISQFEDKLTQEKANRGICDFDDIRRNAYSLLVDKNGKPTSLAQEYADRFDLIFIDEYQDVTEVQDLIFRAVSNGHNRFMVGDIKQSIYSFRGAEPTLFSDYRAAFPSYENAPQDNSGVTVFMSENFRCDTNVIKFVNPICARMFRACGDAISYVDGDDLVFSKQVPDGYVAPKVNVSLITGDDPEYAATEGSDDDVEDSPDAPELQFIASEISHLIKTAKLPDGKPIKPGDIAVLCRSHATCAAVDIALRRLGIPTNSDSTEGYYTRPEVSLVISLLTIIDNPQKDIPLAAVLRSPLFGFTMDDLSLVRRGTPRSQSLYDAIVGASDGQDTLAAKCTAFVQKLESYRHMARALPADRLVRGIYRDASILSLASDEACRDDLMRLYDSARKFEGGSFHGLYNFIKYINRSIEHGKSGDSAPTEPTDAAVNILTFHHSKGLEFSVCFVCGCGKAFTFKDAKRDLIFSRRLGPAARIKDDTGLAKLNTPLRHAAVLECKREQLMEEMRLLYVAMTRAREHLYITAQCLRGLDGRLERARRARQFDTAYPILNATCYLDWILPAISEKPSDDAPYTFSVLYRNNLPTPLEYCANADIAENAEASDKPDPQQFIRQLEERFSFIYPYEHLTKLPAKLSVSRLYPGMLDEQDDASESYDDMNAESSSSLGSMMFSPSFLSDGPKRRITSADKGTATHVFLQFCDFESCKTRGVGAELDRLTKQGFIPRRMADMVNTTQLEAFFESEFYSAISTAAQVHREQRFNIMLPASSFSEHPETVTILEGERLLVQGVIDLFFTDADGKLVLCDYKTDYLTPAEIADPSLATAKLAERHGTQLSYYAAALERICGRRPDRVVIYSLPLGRELDISTDII